MAVDCVLLREIRANRRRFDLLLLIVLATHAINLNNYNKAFLLAPEKCYNLKNRDARLHASKDLERALGSLADAPALGLEPLADRRPEDGPGLVRMESAAGDDGEGARAWRAMGRERVSVGQANCGCGEGEQGTHGDSCPPTRLRRSRRRRASLGRG